MKKIILCISLLIITGCKQSIIESNYQTQDNAFYGILQIPSINMTYGFYDIDNKLNDVSKNVTLLYKNLENTFVLAAHSGTGDIAYFNDLRYISLKDIVYLKFKDKTLEYEVVNIKSEKKTGKISISSNNNLLILTTCDQEIKGNQLIIEANIKKNERM